MNEKLHAIENVGAGLGFHPPSLEDRLKATGIFLAICRDRFGNVLWEDTFRNTVTTVGKNLALDTYLAGSSYTVTGPYMGLISGTPTTAAADTMASHSGWSEVGGTNAPAYSGNRATCAWSAASSGSKALSAGLVFTFTASGTVGG